MPCVALGKFPVPGGISLMLPSLSVSIPDLGADICCKITLPIAFSEMVDLNQLMPAGLAQLIKDFMVMIGAAIDQLNLLLDSIRFDCPLDE